MFGLTVNPRSLREMVHPRPVYRTKQETGRNTGLMTPSQRFLRGARPPHAEGKLTHDSSTPDCSRQAREGKQLLASSEFSEKARQFRPALGQTFNYDSLAPNGGKLVRELPIVRRSNEAKRSRRRNWKPENPECFFLMGEEVAEIQRWLTSEPSACSSASGRRLPSIDTPNAAKNGFLPGLGSWAGDGRAGGRNY